MFFERMGIKLFNFTVYHPQTDGISERINQSVEIIIRFFTINYLEVNFVLTLYFYKCILTKHLMANE